MRILFAACILLVSLTVGCGDSEQPIATPAPDEVLRLRGFNITAANFREAVRTTYIAREPAFCSAIEGFTPREAIDALNRELGLVHAGVPIPGATPVTDEARRSQEDELRAARITLDECSAAAPGATTAPTDTPGISAPSPDT